MENWERDYKWLEVQHFVKNRLNLSKLPDFNSILLLIGIQELGTLSSEYSKAEKQDLMHIATCTILSPEGYYEPTEVDDDGWPHFIEKKPLNIQDEEEQLNFLKDRIIRYFAALINENDETV